MIAFWVAAALISAAAAVLILFRAARAVRLAEAGTAEPASMTVYRRQLAELEELAQRGLLAPDEQRSARAEAARRLLRAADAQSEAAAPSAPAGHARLILLLAAAAAPLAGVVVYLLVGAPGLADQPYLKRVTAWRAQDAASLDPARMTAVLQLIASQRPKDPAPLYYLSRAQLAAGDGLSAEASLKHAIQLSPNDPVYWTGLGETLVSEDDGKVSGDAVRAFARALALDPTSAVSRYFLARARIAGGDLAGGLADWRALEAALPADDPRKASLAQEIALTAQAGALPPAAPETPPQPAAGGDQQAFIRAMVASLAARLQAHPDDPMGWGRLIRSYTVLGDTDRATAARARAQAIFKGRPDALTAVEQSARGG